RRSPPRRASSRARPRRRRTRRTAPPSAISSTGSPGRPTPASVNRHTTTAHPDVSKLQSPYDRGNPGQISRDGHSALVNFEIAGDPDQAQDKVDAILATTAASQQAHPNLRIEQFGGASAGKEVEKMFADDLKKAETISLPVTLIILLFAFGALVAAGLPLPLRLP